MGKVMWVNREPTPEEIAAAEAQALADKALADAQAIEGREERIERRCIRLLIRRQLGQITQAQFAAAVAAIRAAVEAEG